MNPRWGPAAHYYYAPKTLFQKGLSQARLFEPIQEPRWGLGAEPRGSLEQTGGGIFQSRPTEETNALEDTNALLGDGN